MHFNTFYHKNKRLLSAFWAFGSSLFSSFSSRTFAIAVEKASKTLRLSDERKMLETELFMLFTRYAWTKNCRVCLFRTISFISKMGKAYLMLLLYLDGRTKKLQENFKTLRFSRATNWRSKQSWQLADLLTNLWSHHSTKPQKRQRHNKFNDLFDLFKTLRARTIRKNHSRFMLSNDGAIKIQCVNLRSKILNNSSSCAKNVLISTSYESFKSSRIGWNLWFGSSHREFHATM